MDRNDGNSPLIETHPLTNPVLLRKRQRQLAKEDTMPKPSDETNLTPRDLAPSLLKDSVAVAFQDSPHDLDMFLGLLLADLTAALTGMEEAVGQRDLTALGMALHAARGVARSLRSEHPTRILDDIEAAAATGAWSTAGESLARLHPFLTKLQHNLSLASRNPVRPLA